jgi:DNA-binding NarL/FixJ family response regulator
MSSQIARKVVQAFREAVPTENDTEKTFRAGTRSPSLAGQGQFLYKEIASQLNIAYDTVHNYIRRIYEKLRVRSRGQAVAKYFQNSNRLTSLSN